MKKFILLLLILCSCATQKQIDCEKYISTLKIRQPLDKSFEYVYLKSQTVDYDVYVVDDGYAHQAVIKVKNDTIIQIDFRIPRKKSN